MVMLQFWGVRVSLQTFLGCIYRRLSYSSRSSETEKQQKKDPRKQTKTCIARQEGVDKEKKFEPDKGQQKCRICFFLMIARICWAETEDPHGRMAPAATLMMRPAPPL
eukprot:349759-Amphidinium_carterae.1